MKKIFRNWFVYILGFLAQKKINKIRPKIIAITGSVGKTTTKEIVAGILSTGHTVKKTEGNYNSEIGLPLTILNQTAGKGLLSWCQILLQCLFSVWAKESYEYLIVEMGANQPGDIKYLTKIAKPHISIVTSVARIHMDDGQFQNEQEIQKEKSEIVQCLEKGDIALLNADNIFVREMKDWTKAKVKFFGKSKDAYILLKKIKYTTDGLNFTMQHQDKEHTFFVPVFGEFLIYAFLPAIAIGLHENISLENIQSTLKNFSLPKGRFNIIEGIRGSTIIDSSYNASPFSVLESLKSLSKIPGERRIAVLGNMNELGKLSHEEHRKIGAKVAHLCDMLVTLGDEAKLIATEADKRNLTFPIHSFTEREKVGTFLKKNLREGDVVLVKGSQDGVYLEEVIKDIMLYPEQASDILVRQDKIWERRK